MCGVSLKERQPSNEPRRCLGVDAIADVMNRCSRLRWHGHGERNGDADCVKACARLSVEGTAPSILHRSTHLDPGKMGMST